MPMAPVAMLLSKGCAAAGAMPVSVACTATWSHDVVWVLGYSVVPLQLRSVLMSLAYVVDGVPWEP